MDGGRGPAHLHVRLCARHSLFLSPPPPHFLAHATLREGGRGGCSVNVCLFSPNDDLDFPLLLSLSVPPSSTLVVTVISLIESAVHRGVFVEQTALGRSLRSHHRYHRAIDTLFTGAAHQTQRGRHRLSQCAFLPASLHELSKRRPKAGRGALTKWTATRA